MLVLLGALTLLLRLPAFSRTVIDWDESVYALMARSLLEGHWPYTAVWDHKPPGLYALFALGQWVLGPTVQSFRLLAVAAATATSYLLFLYGRDALGNPSVGLLAGVFYVIFSLQNGGLATNAEILMAPLVVLGFYILIARSSMVQPTSRSPARWVLAAGLCFGLAIQIKTVAVFDLAAALLVTVVFGVRGWRPRQDLAGRASTRARHLWTLVLLLLAGAAIPTLAVILVFTAGDHLGAYVQANFTANLAYARTASFSGTELLQSLIGQIRQALVLWVALPASLALAWMLRRSTHTVTLDLAVLAVWFACAFAAVLLGGRYFWHYYLQVLPPLTLIAGLAAVTAVSLRAFRDYPHGQTVTTPGTAVNRGQATLAPPWASSGTQPGTHVQRFATDRQEGPGAWSMQGQWPAGRLLLLALILLPALAQPVYSNAKLVAQEINDLTLGNAGSLRTDQAGYIGAYLRDRLAPDETVYVVDYEPIVYFLAGVDAPTRYVLPALLTRPELFPLISKQLAGTPVAEVERIMAQEPTYVVAYESHPSSPEYEALDRHLAMYYQVDSQVRDVLIYRRSR